jgi:trk system potassium uptake protein TrkH
MSPLLAEQIVLLSILGTIGIGTLLLALPIARLESVSYLDLFFTSTSATTTTGLFTVPLEKFTLFGQAVILILIQIGGLGMITLSLFFLSLFINLGMGTQMIAGNILELDSTRQIKSMIFFIIMVALCTELLGTLMFFSVLHNDYPTGLAFFKALFQSISSFCSAGITIIEGGLSSYNTNYVMILTTMFLMIIGEMGFVTWREIGRYFKKKYDGKPYRFSLHSKIILYGSTTLLICSSIMFWILEHKNILAGLSIPMSILSSIFYAISFRSTGIMLTGIGNFHLATILMIMGLAFIGSSPGSTGGGVKLTTFAVYLATIKAALFGHTEVTIKGRTIAISQVFRAISIISLSVAYILLTTFCLLITEKGFTLIEILFESASAFTSLGASTGITSGLSTVGKLFIITAMIIGRIGAFALILALKLTKKRDTTEYSYPQERVMLS